MRDIAARSLFLLDLFLLDVNRKCDVRYGVVGKRGPACQFSDVLHMRRTHNAFVKNGDVHVKLVECHILLREGSDQIVKLKSCDRQNRLVVEFGVVETVEKMNTAGS